MKNWKRRYFMLDDNAFSYFKSEMVSLSLSPPPPCLQSPAFLNAARTH